MLMNNSIGARLRRSAVTLPLAAIAALCVIGLNEFSYEKAQTSLVQLIHRTNAIDQTQSLLRRMIDAETGERGFLLTGRESYLEPYESATKDIKNIVRNLQAQYRNDPEGKRLVDQMVNTSQEKLSELEATLLMYRQGRHEAWKAVMLTDIGREKMDALRQASAVLLAREDAISAAGRQDLFKTLWINRVGISALTTLGLMGLIVFLRQTQVIHSMRQTHEAELKTERDALQKQVLERTMDLTELAKYLQTDREDEKAKLGRELHDELGALLTASKLDIARLKRSLVSLSPEAANRLDHLSATINTGIGLKRRIIEDLRPSSLSNLGLLAALQIQLREFAQRSELAVTSELHDISVNPDQEIVVYRFVQEALTNIAKHAHASAVHVTFKRAGEEIHLAVRDNGKGFEDRPGHSGSHGLLGMRYRLEAVNGRMSVSPQIGVGTTIEAWFPT